MISNSAVIQQQTGPLDQKGEGHMSSSKKRFSTGDLEGEIWRKLKGAIKDGIFPGAQFELQLPNRRYSLVNNVSICIGTYTYEKDSPLIMWDTSYDVASITKPTTTLVAHYLDYKGKFRMDAPVGDFFQTNECHETWRNLTVGQLSSHQAVVDLSLHFSETRGAETIDAILKSPIRRGYRYGNYLPVVLGQIIERVSGVSLPEVFREMTKGRPDGAEARWFTEADISLARQVAPTRSDQSSILPHDGLTRQIAPIACGVSGLLANAKFVSWILRIILHGGEDRVNGTRMFRSDIGHTLVSNVVRDVPRILAKGDNEADQSKSKPRFSLGMDLLDPDDFDQEDASLIMGTFGFGGYTGCGFLVCPTMMTSMVLLTNAILGKSKEPRIQKLRKEIWNLVLLWHRNNPWGS